MLQYNMSGDVVVRDVKSSAAHPHQRGRVRQSHGSSTLRKTTSMEEHGLTKSPTKSPRFRRSHSVTMGSIGTPKARLSMPNKRRSRAKPSLPTIGAGNVLDVEDFKVSRSGLTSGRSTLKRSSSTNDACKDVPDMDWSVMGSNRDGGSASTMDSSSGSPKSQEDNNNNNNNNNVDASSGHRKEKPDMDWSAHYNKALSRNKGSVDKRAGKTTKGRLKKSFSSGSLLVRGSGSLSNNNMKELYNHKENSKSLPTVSPLLEVIVMDASYNGKVPLISFSKKDADEKSYSSDDSDSDSDASSSSSEEESDDEETEMGDSKDNYKPDGKQEKTQQQQGQKKPRKPRKGKSPRLHPSDDADPANRRRSKRQSNRRDGNGGQPQRRMKRATTDDFGAKRRPPAQDFASASASKSPKGSHKCRSKSFAAGMTRFSIDNADDNHGKAENPSGERSRRSQRMIGGDHEYERSRRSQPSQRMVGGNHESLVVLATPKRSSRRAVIPSSAELGYGDDHEEMTTKGASRKIVDLGYGDDYPSGEPQTPRRTTRKTRSGSMGFLPMYAEDHGGRHKARSNRLLETNSGDEDDDAMTNQSERSARSRRSNPGSRGLVSAHRDAGHRNERRQSLRNDHRGEGSCTVDRRESMRGRNRSDIDPQHRQCRSQSLRPLRPKGAEEDSHGAAEPSRSSRRGRSEVTEDTSVGSKSMRARSSSRSGRYGYANEERLCLSAVPSTPKKSVGLAALLYCNPLDLGGSKDDEDEEEEDVISPETRGSTNSPVSVTLVNNTPAQEEEHNNNMEQKADKAQAKKDYWKAKLAGKGEQKQTGVRRRNSIGC